MKQSQLQQPQYKFYATLLDSFNYFKSNESDTAFSEFINKLNRVPFSSEAAEKGTAYNDLVDRLKGKFASEPNVSYGNFSFPASIVNEFTEFFKNATHQVFTKAILPTSKGNVLLYGYIDELERDLISDIKTTSKYEFGKYLNNYQHLVYPYCLAENNINCERFLYYVTDFNRTYKEEYTFNKERDTERLIMVCEELIDFIEEHRELITDLKVFALDELIKTSL